MRHSLGREARQRRQNTSRGSSNYSTTILGSETINTISCEDTVDEAQVGQGGQAEEAALK